MSQPDQFLAREELFDSFGCPGVMKEHARYFEWCKQLFDLSQAICDRVTAMKHQDLVFVRAFGSLFMNSIGSFVSVVQLCRIGHAADGFRIGRSIVENAIYMKYMVTNKDQLPRDFINFGALSNIKRLKAAREISFMKDKGPELDKRIKEFESELAEQLKECRGRIGSNPPNWTGKSLPKVVRLASEAEEGDEYVKDLYNADYRNFSHYCHADYSSLAQKFDFVTNKFKQYASTEDVDGCLIMVGDVFLGILIHVNQVYALGLEKEIEAARMSKLIEVEPGSEIVL